MEKDYFKDSVYGQIAYEKFDKKNGGMVPDNFRIFYVGWLEENPENFSKMKVTGAQFSGKFDTENKIHGTTQSVIVTRQEMQNKIKIN